MKISNFNLVKTTGNSPINYMFFATIEVESGMLFWKTKRVREISKNFAGYWFFFDTGEYIHDNAVNNLCRAYAAKTGNRYL